MKLKFKGQDKLQYSFNIFILFLITICLSSCTGFSEIEIGEIKNVEVKGFEENSFLVSVDLMVDNPTHHKIRITDIDTKVFLNNQYIGKIISSDDIIFKPKTAAEYSIELKVRLTNILGTAFAMMQLREGNKANVKIEGNLTARSFLMKRKIDITESREITF